MNHKTVGAVLLALALAGCGRSPDAADSISADYGTPAKQAEEYLAYEHNATIELGAEKIEPTVSSVIHTCHSSKEHQCTVLDSEVRTGNYVSASLRMRLSPEFVETILSLASGDGEIRRMSTHIEDLAEPIIDTESKLKMLEGYLDDLLALKSQSEHDIDALIKVTSEIAQTQSKLESLRGDNAYLRQRVDLDILTLRFQVQRNQTFWAPIGEAFGDFGDSLSEGISEAITGFAYLLPWLFILVPLLFLVRYLWRRFR